MDYVNYATERLSTLGSFAVDNATSLKNRLFPPAQPTGILGGRRKTRRRRNHKVKRRRTGKKSIGFPALPFLRM